ncbi:hypothetical protein Droror1_Dr00013016 [Drosera rotundifolia]
MEGGGVSMRKGEEGQRGLEIVVSRDMPNHESPLSPPPTSDAAAESENLGSPSSGNGSSCSVSKREILVDLFARSLDVLLTILLLILFLPLYLLVLGASAFFGINPKKFEEFLDPADRLFKEGEFLERGKKGIYEKVEEFLDPAVRLAKWVPIIRNRVLLFILLWVIINLSVAGLRKKNVLGSKLWEWTLLIVILSCGYHAISMVIRLCLYFLGRICKDKKDKKEVLYYAKGLRRSINMVIFSCSLLLIWQFYFRSDHGLKQTSDTDEVFDLGTRTLFSLLIFALLWLLKSILLLKWEAHVVYERFLDRILTAGFQVYFLALMSGKEWEIFRPEGNRSSEETQEEGDTNDNNSGLSREATTPEGNKTEKQRKAKGSQESYGENKNGAEDIAPAGDQKLQGEVLNDNNNVPSGDSTVPEGNKAEKQTKKNENEGSHEETRKRAKNILHVEHMLSKNVSTYAIRKMVKYFVALKKVSSSEGGDATTGIFSKFELLCDEEMKPLYKQLQERDSLEMFLRWIVERRLLLFRDRDYGTVNDVRDDLYKQLQSKREDSYEKFKDWVVHATFPYVTKEDLSDRFKLNDKDAELLYKQLQDGESKVSYEMFKDWVKKALKNCLTLGQTLLDAKEVVNCLKHILNCFVFAMFILSWLLLTEIATTKVLVLIASPLLAASFIFGGTCKTLFEGIIFAFINHPFDVGDQCVIDGTEMEVKHVNILTTTFVRMGTKEVALYPNSVLATKAIINRKLEPDPNDTIELSLDCSTLSLGSGSSKLAPKGRIAELEKQIKEYIKNNRKFEGSGHIMVKHIGNNIKIVVHFKHSMSILDATHSQCSEKKNKQRSEFLLQIIDYLDELNIKIATA